MKRVDVSDRAVPEAPRRRAAVLAMAGALACASAMQPASAADHAYPEKPVRLVVGFATGTPPEIMARLIANQFTKAMGQAFYVDARPGAGSTTATAAVARAKPDGYTLMLGVASGLGTGPHVIPTAGYDPRRDLEPIGFVQRGPYYISVRSDLPIHDLKSMLAYQKSAATPLVFGSLGVGSVHHLLWELLMAKSGAQLTHLPFGGTPQMVNEALAGRVDLMLETASSLTVPYVKAGKFRYIAMTGESRGARFPDVATVREQGFPELESQSWWVLVAPKGTPDTIVRRLNAELAKALQSTEAQQLLDSVGGASSGAGTPQEVRELIRAEYERWGDVIAKTNIKIGG